MSEIFNDIQSKIKTAMFKNDNFTRDCLRMIVSDIKNQTVNANPQKEITDDVCLKILQKSAKTHKDSIEQFKSAGRVELAEKEEEELKIIESFLPKMLSEDETKTIIENILTNVEATKKNMGIIMKQLPNEVDKKIASKLLAKMLS
jgi:uncharacterized protein YqeY